MMSPNDPQCTGRAGATLKRFSCDSAQLPTEQTVPRTDVAPDRDRSVRRRRRGQASLLVLAGTMALGVPLTTLSTGSAGADEAHSATTDSSVLRGTPTTQEILEQILEDLQNAKNKVSPPAPPDERPTARMNSGLAADLDAAEALIDQLLSPLTLPNLAPAEAGMVDMSVAPNTLEDYAASSVTLAQEALAAHYGLSQPMRDETIGTKLKTIKHLLPGYRQAAGL